MEERRIDRVRVPLSRGVVTLPWASRDALLAEFKNLESFGPIRAAFEAVGTTAPVRLTREQKVDLVQLIGFWSNQVAGGFAGLPEGIYELRNALTDDLYDADQRATT